MYPIITIENLHYAYPSILPGSDPNWVLRGIDLVIRAGEFIAVMGPTGEGKSTLCMALNGIVPQSTGGAIRGSVRVNGLDSKRTPVAELAHTVGLVFQKPDTQLFNMTVESEVAFGLETMGLPRSEMHQRIDWALETVGMSGLRQRSPFELSGGQKQRVAIAAILAMKPPVLVLDEPTANLDPQGKREVFAAVDALRKQEGITIIMVSHESEKIAAFAQRVVVLYEGKVALDGPPEKVFSPTRQLNHMGLQVPQVSQLSDCLNQKLGTDFAFTQVDEAQHALREMPISPSAPGSETAGPANGAASEAAPLFKLANLTYNYTHQHYALNDVSMSIYKGEYLAVLGQNGSGKTTLVKHLNGLLRPSRGSVQLNGEDIAGSPVAELARTVGFVFQNPDHMIFSATVREEIAAGPRNLGLAEGRVNQQVEETLDQFGLQPYAELQPALLSFGLRRKVTVAAVVAMQTDVLILDEPTSGLDQRNTDELMAILKKLNQKGRTIIIISHDMRLVARHVPTAALLHQGRLLAYEPTRRIFQRDDLLKSTQLEAPQISWLGRQLGLPENVISVGELCSRLSHGDIPAAEGSGREQAD